MSNTNKNRNKQFRFLFCFAKNKQIHSSEKPAHSICAKQKQASNVSLYDRIKKRSHKAFIILTNNKNFPYENNAIKKEEKEKQPNQMLSITWQFFSIISLLRNDFI